MFKFAVSVPALLALLLLSACQTASPPAPGVPAAPEQAPVVAPVAPTAPPVVEAKPQKASYKQLDFGALPGWQQDRLVESWPAFRASCAALAGRDDWREICTVAGTIDGTSEQNIRQFFEAFFVPYQIINPDGSDTGLITGYYEPLLQGAHHRGGKFQTPLYRPPADLLDIELASVYPELKGMRLRGYVVGNKVLPYPDRAELLASGNLKGKEICWVDDSIDAFFLQVQGSGRVHFADTKETIRVAYADQNGQPYKSIGRYLVDKGELTLDQASAQGIRSWIQQHPSRESEVLNANPSFVFFKEQKLSDPKRGPDGALGVALTERRSIAVDPRFVPLGVPVFLNFTLPNSELPVQRLMMAQDTGGAIRGAVRADFFWGFGKEAGDMAGRMKQRGSLWLLWPKSASTAPGEQAAQK